MKKLFFILFCFLILISCKDEIIVESVNDEGTVIERFEATSDSTKNGLYEAFYDNGQLSSTVIYDAGKTQGERRMFYEEGGIKASEFYVNDTIHGPFKSYYENGKIDFESNFVNGVMVGLGKKYYKNGALMEEVNFVDNEENGPFKEYYQNGQIEWSGNYLNGDNEFGLLQHYNKEGVLDKKMMCDSLRKCKTIWTLETGDVL